MKYKPTLAAVLLAASIQVSADELIGISILPFNCDKSISRFRTTDVPVAVFNSREGVPGEWRYVESVVIDGWIQATRVRIVNAKRTPEQKPWCGVRPNGSDSKVAVYYFPVSEVLRAYDWQPYTSIRVTNVLRLSIKVRDFDQTFVGFGTINIIR